MTGSGNTFNNENKNNQVLYKFFETSSSRKQILDLVEQAGPLNQLESYIRRAYARNESDLQNTLMTAIAMAAQRLDFTLRDYEGIAVDKGMVERLLELHAELFPDNQAAALQQAREATVLSKEKYINVLEKIIVSQITHFDKDEKADASLQQLSDAFIQNNEETLTQAINNFKTSVNTQQDNMKDNPDLYYANLMYLINGIKKLPAQWNGNSADRFYSEILGVIRESVNRAVIKQVFDAHITDIKANIFKAIKMFRQFQKQTMLFSINEQNQCTNNLLNLNNIHLLCCAFDELSRRARDLPGSHFGKNANLFSIKIIGALFRCLQPRIKQTLSYPQDDDIYLMKEVSRSFENMGEKYFKFNNSQFKTRYLLYIFGTVGYRTTRPMNAAWREAARIFENLLQVMTSAPNYYPTVSTRMSQTVSMCDDVETSRSLVAKRQKI